MKKKNAGITTMVVVCAMAVIMALSLGLFLTASVLMNTAAKTGAAQQCRILAVSFSKEIEKELIAEKRYESLEEEEAGRVERKDTLSLWHYIKQNITDGSWPYLEEKGTLLHRRENAVRSFQMGKSGIAGEIAETTLALYWLPGTQENRPGKLVVETTVTVKEQTCTITDVYELQTAQEGSYESWNWEHVDKK